MISVVVPKLMPATTESSNHTARNVISRSSQQTEKRPERARAHEEADYEDDGAAGHRRGQTAMSKTVATIDPASPITPQDGSGTDCSGSTGVKAFTGVNPSVPSAPGLPAKSGETPALTGTNTPVPSAPFGTTNALAGSPNGTAAAAPAHPTLATRTGDGAA
jgi:hypothetical protein